MSGVASIVLAAGQSRRMKSDVPKVLHQALGQPLLGYAVQAARAAGATRVVAVVRPEHEAAVAEALRPIVSGASGAATGLLTLAHQAEAKGTAHAVLCGRAALDASGSKVFEGTLLVLLGDAPCVSPTALQALLREHAERKAALSVLTGDAPQPKGYGRIVRGEGGDLAAIVEEKDASDEVRRITEINSGVMAFELPFMWSILEKITPSPKTGELYLTDAIELTRKAGKKTHAVKAAAVEDVLGVNDRAQLAQVTAILRRRINAAHMANGVTIVDPETTFIDARAELEQDVTIEPFTVIEGPCKLARGARVGPFARLRASTLASRAVIGNFVEVVRSEVGAGARALHLAYLGDARVGADANVGAGAITANFDGVAKHETTIEAGASIGSGTVLVAPARVAAGARTGAGAIVTRGVTVPAGETWVGVPARPISERRRIVTGGGA